MGSGTFYELICFSVFLVAAFVVGRLWVRGDEVRLLSVFLVGLFFAVGWEPQGTGLVWRYPGYWVYAFMEIPLALLLSWSWWMVACRIIADKIDISLERILGRRSLLSSTAALYISGVLVALVVEPLSVSMGWWEYLVVGEMAILHFPLLGVNFNLTVIIGWGFLTTLNLVLSERARSVVSRKEGVPRISTLLTLGSTCAVLGLFSGWLSWQIVGFFAAYVEREAPRVFFTRYYIYILEGVDAGLLIGMLVVASLGGYFIWRSFLDNEGLL
jgi:hypothetical protein